MRSGYPPDLFEAGASLVLSERTMMGWSQQRLATEALIAQCTVGKVERFGGNVGVLKRIADALNSEPLRQHVRQLQSYDRRRKELRLRIIRIRNEAGLAWAEIARRSGVREKVVRGAVDGANNLEALRRVYEAALALRDEREVDDASE